MRAKRTVELRYSVINPIAIMEGSKLELKEMENDLKEIS
jgi:hypothetical protein